MTLFLSHTSELDKQLNVETAWDVWRLYVWMSPELNPSKTCIPLKFVWSLLLDLRSNLKQEMLCLLRNWLSMSIWCLSSALWLFNVTTATVLGVLIPSNREAPGGAGRINNTNGTEKINLKVVSVHCVLTTINVRKKIEVSQLIAWLVL